MSLSLKRDLPFRHYKAFMQEQHGTALYRVPVDFGFSCPNRNADGSGGCTFCAEDGGRARQIIGAEDITEQITRGIQFARQRYKAEKFMLYIQAYTGTFTDISTLRKMLLDILNRYTFSAISIGTRPDCISDEVLQLLLELKEHLEVWVELGVQTTHDETLNHINRGHNWPCSRQAILTLHKNGLFPAVHVILGLPGEDRQHWQQSAERLARLPLAAIKFHNLHVIKGTILAAEFADFPFPLLNEHDYADAVIDFLRRLPPDLPVMRLTTDTAEEKLIAPIWSLSKGQFLDYLIKQMRFRHVRQGDLFGGRKRKRAEKTTFPPSFSPIPTEDGSVTFWNPLFKEHYHSKVGAFKEAQEKFILPSNLAERLSGSTGKAVQLLDICFGLGYNTLAACEKVQKRKRGHLSVTALEIDAGVIAAAAHHITVPGSASFDWTGCLSDLVEKGQWGNDYCTISLIIGDARNSLPKEQFPSYDIVFLDAFSTQRNAELWTLDFLRQIKNRMAPEGTLLTYCAALPVRAAMLEAGFFVGETPAIGRKRGGTIAAIQNSAIQLALPEADLKAIAATSRGIPYRDPDLTRTSRQILRDREKRVQAFKECTA